MEQNPLELVVSLDREILDSIYLTREGSASSVEINRDTDMELVVNRSTGTLTLLIEVDELDQVGRTDCCSSSLGHRQLDQVGRTDCCSNGTTG